MEKGLGLLLLGKPKGEKSEDENEGATSAANAALKAIKSGDAEAFSEALKLHYELCQADAMYDRDEKEDEE